MPPGSQGFYPLPDPHLELHRLAQLWLPAHPGLDQTELYDTLLAEFWSGRLRATLSGDSCDFDVNRSNMLDAMAQCDDHPGIIFTRDPVSSVEIEQPSSDGAVDVFTGVVVQWPIGDDELDRNEAKARAYLALSGAEFDDYSDLVKPALYGLRIDRETFRAYLRSRGIDLPEFWFGKGAGSKRPAQADVTRWLKKRFVEVSPNVTRRMLLDEAKNRFPGLTESMFERSWADAAPPERRRPGRRGNRPRK